MGPVPREMLSTPSIQADKLLPPFPSLTLSEPEATHQVYLKMMMAVSVLQTYTYIDMHMCI